jgi:hypothetical protein
LFRQLRYLDAWKGMFDAQLKKLEERSQFLPNFACERTHKYGAVSPWPSIPSISSNGILNTDSQRSSKKICSACFCSITSWLSLLQKIDRLSDLKAALTASVEPTQLSSTYVIYIPGLRSFSEIALRFQGGLCSECSKGQRCFALQDIAGDMLKNIEELPPFTSFLNEDFDGEAVVGEATDAN